MTKTRLVYIDSLKGFAIILVVLGHIIQFMYSPNNFDNNRIYRYIYCFHMPLFMMLSGFVTPVRYENFQQVIHKLKKRFMQLVIPFISWSALDCLLIGSNDVFRVLRYPDYGLWFLWVLFWINTFYIIGLWVLKFIKPSYIYISILIVYIVLRLLCMVFSGNYGIGLMILYYPFFSIGSILGFMIFAPSPPTHIIQICNLKKILLSNVIIILFLFYVISGFFWYRISPLTEENWITELNSMSLYRFLVPLSGCFLFFLLFYIIDKRSKILQRLNLHKIGMYTLPIYAIHQTVIIRVIMPCSTDKFHELFTTWYGFFIAFTLVLLITFIIYYVFNKNKYLSFLFLGINKLSNK